MDVAWVILILLMLLILLLACDFKQGNLLNCVPTTATDDVAHVADVTDILGVAVIVDDV